MAGADPQWRQAFLSPKMFGIDQNEFFELMPTMAEQALQSGSPGNNPRVPTAEEIIEIYRTLW
jgi:alcohol dehydrogenase class IV